MFIDCSTENKIAQMERALKIMLKVHVCDTHWCSGNGAMAPAPCFRGGVLLQFLLLVSGQFYLYISEIDIIVSSSTLRYVDLRHRYH